jgi:hypothetical protein
MAAVRLGTCLEPGKITSRLHVRPPTDVIAITSLPIARLRWQVAAPGGGWQEIRPLSSALDSVLNPALIPSPP